VRGLLTQPTHHHLVALDGPSPMNSGSASPKELVSPSESEKFLPSMKDARRQPEDHPAPGAIGLAIQPSPRLLSRDVSSQNGVPQFDAGGYQDPYEDPEFSFVSTLDLLAIPDVTAQFAGLNMSPSSLSCYSISPSSSPDPARLLPLVPAGTPIPRGANFSSPYLGTSPKSITFGTSPSYNRPRVPPKLLPVANPPPSYSAIHSQAQRLAPDRYGNVIPPGATWTKIKRTLVSPEVLHRAGVRYEARPTFVAVLGKLTLKDVAEFTKQSTEARAARQRSTHRFSHGSSSDDSSEESDVGNFRDDKGRSEKRRYPIIVDPPGKGASPTSTVMPKSILKNKNDNHVRFDLSSNEEFRLEDDRKSDTMARNDRHRRRVPIGEVDSDRRDRDRERNQDRNRDRHREKDRNRDRDRDHNRRPYRRDRDRDGYRDRDHERGDRERDRDRDRDRDTPHDRDRPVKRKTWSDALGAAGIGGAAVSLLSVLSEAAL
jgi:hypothetical protein